MGAPSILPVSVKSRKTNRHAVSDWMEIEKTEKGFLLQQRAPNLIMMGYRVNILDTTGAIQDFE